MRTDGDAGVFLSVQEVRSLAETGALQLVDARSLRAYEEGHLPGALSLPARDLNPTVDGTRTLISSERLAERLHALGLGAGPAVVYAADAGADAAHLWWTLDAYGHPAVHLLDGGLRAWQDAGLPLDSGAPATTPVASPFEPRFDPARLVTREELLTRLDDDALRIVDTRSREEFDGTLAAARRGGHLPGAVHADWEEAVDADGRLCSEETLRRSWSRTLAAPEIATYCQSGVRAAHACAVLRHLGHANARLYLGSWAEWGNRTDTPIDTHVPMEVTS
ncbi:MAG: sulfurtransferase [Trueperaceae bacterium]